MMKSHKTYRIGSSEGVTIHQKNLLNWAQTGDELKVTAELVKNTNQAPHASSCVNMMLS